MNEIKFYLAIMDEAAVAEQKEDWICKHQDFMWVPISEAQGTVHYLLSF